MPFEVAPAPVPSWERAGESGTRSIGAKPVGSKAASKPHGLDAAFLCRLHVSVGYVGALALLLVNGASTSLAAASFGTGYGLGWALLASQGFVVRRMLQPGALRGRAARGEVARRMAWWVLVPLKYLVVAALLRWALREAAMAPGWIAFGFGLVHFVMLAKVLGRAMSGSVKTVRQAYIERG